MKSTKKLIFFRIFALLFSLQFLCILLLVSIRRFSYSTRLPDQVLLIGLSLAIPSALLGKQRFLKFRNREVDFEFKLLVFLTSFFMFLTIGLQTFTNVDRSRSLFMFEWIKCAPSGTTLTTLENLVEVNFGNEARIAFKQRLDEQQSRGFIKVVKNEPKLTKSGDFIFHSAVLLSRLANLKGWQNNFLWKSNLKCGS